MSADDRDPRPPTGDAPSGGVAGSVSSPPHVAAPADPPLGVFAGEAPTRDPAHWTWLWGGDRVPPSTSPEAGPRGLLKRLVRRLLRRPVLIATRELWERQRRFNLVQLAVQEERAATLREELAALRAHHQALLAHTDRMQEDYQGALAAHASWLEHLEKRTSTGFQDVMRHNDALFSRVDQKLDRYRGEARELWHRLGALIAAQAAAGEAAAGPAAVAQTAREVQREQAYVAFEQRFRGSEEEIERRVAAYLPYLEGRGPVMDLGCGRGEALEVFRRHGLATRGVDASSEMVARCRAKGLEVEEGDLLRSLAGVAEGSLGAVVSFHVVEHLPPEVVDRLVRLAWRALRPGGVLILETPSPLSLVTAARGFWVDPTHLRPVHPDSLESVYREAGFEPVHRLDLHPFPDEQRLPEIALADLDPAQRPLADQVNRLRDLLDELLFGHRDYGLVGEKPAPA